MSEKSTDVVEVGKVQPSPNKYSFICISMKEHFEIVIDNYSLCGGQPATLFY
jgi:hypothetical protein